MSDQAADPAEPLGRELTGIELHWSRAKRVLIRLRRKLPYLVWYGDELDVSVTLKEDKLDPHSPLRSFQSGPFRRIENQLNELGIGFDTGQGCGGRDWEWDWSLRGPISVQFRCRASKPERRTARASSPKHAV